MVIRRLKIKNFGKIRAKDMELSPGINVLYGENESGKTTTHTFIRSMFYGVRRLRGKAALNDTYTKYEPWENPAEYGGIMWFTSKGKKYRLTRNFYKEKKLGELLCEDDGSLVDAEQGALGTILGNVSEAVYDNTVSVAQLKSVTGKDLVRELQNYMASYQGTGDSSIDMGRAMQMLKMSRKGYLTEAARRKKELEKEKLKTELAFLKNQVSPHFFMNTLNNIHALIDINSEDAKESLIKLSKLMRYLLYDSETGKTTLAKEIEFIKSYVDLMKLRFTEKVSVKLSFPEKIPNIEIPPMLFTSLLENAFKHGVSYQKESFIEIIMNANNEFLFFRIINSKQKSGNGIVEKGGIGLENLQKRLELIYGKDYSFVQTESENDFEINIKLPING